MMENRNTQSTPSTDRIKINVGGKHFETTTATLRSGGPDSLLDAFSHRHSDDSDPLFIDRDPDIFSVLLSLLRSNRLPSTANRFSNQELADEAAYYGIESQLKSAMLPIQLNGIDASVVSTIKPASDGVVSTFTSHDDGSVWIAHGGQVSAYDWNLTHSNTVRTHLENITSITHLNPEIAAVGSENASGIHFYSFADRNRVGSTEWSDPSDPRIYKARVTSLTESPNSIFASLDCYHRENCVLEVDKSSLKTVSEIGRQLGNSSKTIAPGKLTYIPDLKLIVGCAITSGAFGFSGYVRLWDIRSGKVVWETNEPGTGRSSRFGDPFADVVADPEELNLFKLCSKSGDLAVADMRKLSEDPWVYLEDQNPSMKNSGGGNVVMHCYRKQVFVGREGGLEVWSRVEDSRVYRRNYVDKLEDCERGVIKRIQGGGDRLFVSREDVEGIEVWQTSSFSSVLSLL